MEKISNKVFGGERPLFEIHNVELDHVRITFGESGVRSAATSSAATATSRANTRCGM